jgi:hypothetical protein
MILAPLHIAGRPSRSSGFFQGIPILRRHFSSHEQLHDILRHSASARSPVSVEIAIECDHSLTRALEYKVSLLYDFVWHAKRRLREGEQQAMQIVLRYRLRDEAILKEMEVTRPLVGPEYPQACWEGRTWACKAGKTLGDDEWKKYWAEGEN